MAKVSVNQWATARLKWESEPACSYEDIAKTLGITRAGVRKKALLDQWTKTGSLRALNERAQIFADSVTSQFAGYPQKADVIDASVHIRADVIERHRADWSEHRKLFTTAAIAEKFELGKSAKITAEMLAIRQKGERLAYGMDDVHPPQNVTHSGTVEHKTVIEVASIVEHLDKLV